MEQPRRCVWAQTPTLERYHDLEWGVPVHNDQKLFELLTLEGAQAGLSWDTILKKRDGYLEVFDGFDPEIVATYGPERIDALVVDQRIVRNRLKITATVTNAAEVLRLAREAEGFANHLWSFVGGATKQNSWSEMSDLPSRSPESDAMSKDLTKRGFKFVGSTICYALMQASGMVNDHVVGCYRYADLNPGSSPRA